MNLTDEQIDRLVSLARGAAANEADRLYKGNPWGEFRAALAAARAEPAEPVMWQYRTHFGNNTALPGWGPWEEVKPRNPHVDTVADRVAEIRDYIAQGCHYELRPLYAAPQVALAEPWRQAIDDALVAGGQDCLGPEESPAAAVNRLISHEVRVALDPAVSSEAQALIERGRAEPAGGRDERGDALREALELIAGTDPVDAALDPQRAVRVARAALAAARSSLAAPPSQQPQEKP